MKDSVRLLIKDPKLPALRKRGAFENAAKDVFYNGYAINHQHLSNIVNYGYLYNWWSATDARNIANTDCHVPTDAEWKELSTYCGGIYIVGVKLKSVSGWDVVSGNGTDDYGFNAKPAGYRIHYYGDFDNLLYTTFWWGSDEPYSNSGTECYIGSNPEIWHGFRNKKTGESVRLIKNTTTLSHGQTGTYTGNDGKVYNTICIGTQEWLSENLAETRYRNGDLITKVTDNTAWAALTTEAYCAYANDESNAFELVYDFAPAGYHVMTAVEVGTIATELGGTSVAGGKMKEAGLAHWLTPNTGADNSSGFTGLPSGTRNSDGVFQYRKEYGAWWLGGDTLGAALIAYSNAAIIIEADIETLGANIKYGLSVRLVKDDGLIGTGRLTDIDGNDYELVDIGGVVVTKTNIATEHFIDGSSIPLVPDNEAWAGLTTPGRCIYSEGIIYTASVDPDTLTWEEYETTEKRFEVTTNLQKWYIGSDSSYAGFTIKVYDGETEIIDGVYHTGYFVGLTPANENVGGAERQFSINIADWKNQTLATATGSQPAGPGADANAGTNKNIHGSFGATMDAIPSIGSGVWILVNGPGSTIFDDENSATTDITVSAYGGYRFRWTETFMGVPDSAEITITFYPY